MAVEHPGSGLEDLEPGKLTLDESFLSPLEGLWLAGLCRARSSSSGPLPLPSLFLPSSSSPPPPAHPFSPLLSALPIFPLVAQLVKNPHATRETWAQSLGWEDPLEKGTATHSSILARRIPWTATVHGVTKSWTWLSDFHQIVLNILLKSWAPVNHLVTIQRIRSTEKWPIARNIVFHRSIKSFYFRFFPPDALS